MEKGNSKAIIFITILIVLFLYNAFKFIESRGSNIQMTNTLFNMVFIIAIIILIIHKKDLDKKTQMFQKKIEDYF